jgi:hypothetical protein
MKITGTRSNIFIEYEGKTIIMDGEMVVNGFYAETNTMRWKPPFESVPISNELKNKIISDAIKETKDKDFKIFFE